MCACQQMILSISAAKIAAKPAIIVLASFLLLFLVVFLFCNFSISHRLLQTSYKSRGFEKINFFMLNR